MLIYYTIKSTDFNKKSTPKIGVLFYELLNQAYFLLLITSVTTAAAETTIRMP